MDGGRTWIGAGLTAVGALSLVATVYPNQGAPARAGDLLGGAAFSAAGVYLLTRPQHGRGSGHARTRRSTVGGGVTRHNSRARYRRH